MSDETIEQDPPSSRVVLMARGWLVVLGTIWLLVGIVSGFTVNSEMLWLSFLCVVTGILHFVAARFASGRIAVFFALFGP
jgi:hypothetical protein